MSTSVDTLALLLSSEKAIFAVFSRFPTPSALAHTSTLAHTPNTLRSRTPHAPQAWLSRTSLLLALSTFSTCPFPCSRHYRHRRGSHHCRIGTSINKFI